MTDVRGLTLWQPWASLVATGVKTIETRRWATTYRGRLAIHAARRLPSNVNDRVGEYVILADADLGATPDNRFLVRWPVGESLSAKEPWRWVPLGAVVAVCTLADVVPMVEPGAGCQDRHVWLDPDYTMRAELRTPDAAGWGGWAEPTDITTQLPYGDFAAGRYAWLLADVQALPEPIPAVGRQGLWRPDPELLAQLPTAP